LSAFRSLDPAIRQWAEALLEVAVAYRLGPHVLSTFRSFSEQQRLYEAYLRGESRNPVAPPGRSLHNYGHAFDLQVSTPEGQRWLGEVWEYWGGRWGGRFDDPNHFDTGAVIT